MTKLNKQQFMNCNENQKLTARIDGKMYKGFYDCDHGLFIRYKDFWCFRFKDCQAVYCK